LENPVSEVELKKMFDNIKVIADNLETADKVKKSLLIAAGKTGVNLE
jgi:hypothetical protein